MIPESALALRGSPYRVPFRERTRGESSGKCLSTERFTYRGFPSGKVLGGECERGEFRKVPLGTVRFFLLFQRLGGPNKLPPVAREAAMMC